MGKENKMNLAVLAGISVARITNSLCLAFYIPAAAAVAAAAAAFPTLWDILMMFACSSTNPRTVSVFTCAYILVMHSFSYVLAFCVCV